MKKHRHSLSGCRVTQKALRNLHFILLGLTLIWSLSGLPCPGSALMATATDMAHFAIALLFIPPVTAGLTLGLLIFTVLAWKNKYYSLIGRLHYSLITLAGIGFIFFLNYWNMLG